LRKLLNITKKKQRSGLIVLSAILIPLQGCAGKQLEPASVLPDYSSEFLLCVADEMETHTYGECTERVVSDWTVIIGG